MRTQLSLFLIIILSSISGCPVAENSRKELRTNEVKGHKISQIGPPVQHDVVDPTRVTQVTWRPRVFLYKSFLSEEECDHLISWVQGKKSKSITDDDIDKDKVVSGIEERISAWTFIPKENGRPLQVLHFDSETSKQNNDYFNKEFKTMSNEPLMATVILYLSNVSQGGQILFPETENDILSDCTRSSMALKPTKGNAIVIFNVHLNASSDKSSSLARCPILEGDMWSATKIFHLKAVGKEKEPLQLDNTGCTDEDENCPRWAAMGECQRNPVFMVGSPDYYGTCRKSCNVC